jgi:hypothetical protein
MSDMSDREHADAMWDGLRQALASEAAEDLEEDGPWAEAVSYDDGKHFQVLVRPADRQPFVLDAESARAFADDLVNAAQEVDRLNDE